MNTTLTAFPMFFIYFIVNYPVARNTPFTLEFMSDDIDGQGGETGNTEWQSATQNRGFQLHVDQIDCS